MGLIGGFDLGVEFVDLAEDFFSAAAEGAEFGGLGRGECDGGACPASALEE
jgi:hypothetical protein